MGDVGENQAVRSSTRRSAKVVLLLVLGIGALYLAGPRRGGTPQGWLTDLEQARRQAAKSGQFIFVDFGADWCLPCRMMEREVFPDPRVRDALADFIRVRIDVDAQPEPARRHAVVGLPTLIVMDHAGTVLARYEGGMSVAGLVQFLEAANRPH